MSIQSEVTSNITTVKSMISSTLSLVNTYLGAITVFLNPNYVTAGQTKNAAGTSPPAIEANKPNKPQSRIPETAPLDSYSTGFVMPEAGTIDDNSLAKGDFNWQEPVYEEWMLSELKTKIGNGFDDIAMTMNTQNGIWERLIQRHITALKNAINRRTTRWTGRGFNKSSEILNERKSEIITKFGYAYDDYLRDNNIKIAELKLDNKKFSINAALKGEALVIQQAEDIAVRALDVAKTVLELSMKVFEMNTDRYINVTVEQYKNSLYYFTKNLLMKIGKAKADVIKYITNTKIIAGKTRMIGLKYEADIDAYETDNFYNEMKAGINIDFNALSINELENNIDLKLKQLAENKEAFLKIVTVLTGYADKIGIAYAEYLKAAMEAINSLLHIVNSYKEIKES